MSLEKNELCELKLSKKSLLITIEILRIVNVSFRLYLGVSFFFFVVCKFVFMFTLLAFTAAWSRCVWPKMDLTQNPHSTQKKKNYKKINEKHENFFKVDDVLWAVLRCSLKLKFNEMRLWHKWKCFQCYLFFHASSKNRGKMVKQQLKSESSVLFFRLILFRLCVSELPVSWWSIWTPFMGNHFSRGHGDGGKFNLLR